MLDNLNAQMNIIKTDLKQILVPNAKIKIVKAAQIIVWTVVIIYLIQIFEIIRNFINIFYL